MNDKKGCEILMFPDPDYEFSYAPTNGVQTNSHEMTSMIRSVTEFVISG